MPIPKNISKRTETEKSRMETSRIQSFLSQSQEASRITEGPASNPSNPPISKVSQVSAANQTDYPKTIPISSTREWKHGSPNPNPTNPSKITQSTAVNQNQAEKGQKSGSGEPQGNPWNCSNKCITCLIISLIVLGSLCLLFGGFSIFALIILFYNGDFEGNWNYLTASDDPPLSEGTNDGALFPNQ